MSVVSEEKRGFCTLCKSRCGAIFTIEDGRLTGVRPDPGHPTGTAMCPKGRAAPEIAHSTNRLTTPLRRTNPKSDPDPGWVPVSWDEGMEEIAEKIGAIAAESGPESVAFAVATPSGTMVSDATEWIERFVRLFGSPNTVYSAEICNWHKDFAHAFTFGSPIPPPDYANADLALLWGFNPAKTWLSQSAALSAAQATGTKLAVVDPRRSTSALRADHWLRVRPGTDAALALGLAHLLIADEGYDADFVRAWTNGPLLVRADTGRFLRADELPGTPEAGFAVFDEGTGLAEAYDTARAAVRPERFALRGTRAVALRDGSVVDCAPAFERYAAACAPWPPARVAATTWIPEREIRALAAEIAAAPSVTYYGWTGVGQSANAAQTERALATLYALTGSYDAPGGNHVVPAPPCNPATSFAQFAPEQRAKALGLHKHPLGPPAFGYINSGDLCTAIETGRPYPVRALVGFGSNLVVAQPDSDRTARALGALDFQVHLDLFHNPTSSSADIVLPVNSSYEHEALRFGFEVSHRAQEQVQLRPRMVEPQGESRSDTEFVFDLACRLGMGTDFFGGDIEAAWNWQLEPLGLTVEELRRQQGGVRVPLAEAYRKYASRVAGDADEVTGFATPTRRVELYSERLLEHGYPAVPEHRNPAPTDAAYPLVLTCAKHGYFVHSQQRSLTSLRRRATDPSVDLHPRTAAAHGIGEGQWVELATRLGSIRLRARFDDSLHPSVVVGEYGWWQEATDLALPGADPIAATGSNFNRPRRPRRDRPAQRLRAAAVRRLPDQPRTRRRRLDRDPPLHRDGPHRGEPRHTRPAARPAGWRSPAGLPAGPAPDRPRREPGRHRPGAVGRPQLLPHGTGPRDRPHRLRARRTPHPRRRLLHPDPRGAQGRGPAPPGEPGRRLRPPHAHRQPGRAARRRHRHHPVPRLPRNPRRHRRHGPRGRPALRQRQRGRPPLPGPAARTGRPHTGADGHRSLRRTRYGRRPRP